MANECYFDIIATGRKDNVKRFIDIITDNDKEMRLFGIYQADDCGIKEEIGMMCSAEVWGYCKWSVNTSMTGFAHSYFDDYSIDIRKNPEKYVGKEKYFTHLDELSQLLKINIQVYSNESGCAFCEYYEFSPNENPIECIGDYNEWAIEDIETYKQCKEIYTKEYGKYLDKDENGEIIMPFSEEDFNTAIQDEEYYIAVSDFTMEDKFHDVLKDMIPEKKVSMIRLVDKEKEPYKPMREYWEDIKW